MEFVTLLLCPEDLESLLNAFDVEEECCKRIKTQIQSNRDLMEQTMQQLRKQINKTQNSTR